MCQKIFILHDHTLRQTKHANCISTQLKLDYMGRFVKLMTWQNLLRWLQLINLHVHSLAVDRNYNFSPHQESQTLAGGD